MLNSGLDPTLLIVLSILALVTILVVLVVCALVAFRYHFVVVVDVAVVVVHPRSGVLVVCAVVAFRFLFVMILTLLLDHDAVYIKLPGAAIWRGK